MSRSFTNRVVTLVCNCVQFLHDDYDQAEQFYMRALDAEPSDRRIVENYNYLLQTYKRADYDAYEAFRRLQVHGVLVCGVSRVVRGLLSGVCVCARAGGASHGCREGASG